MSEKPERPCWCNLTITIPTVVAETLEEFAQAAEMQPGLLATTCLMQGFALQLRDNGHQDLCDDILEGACLMVEQAGTAKTRHARLPDLVPEMLH